jgi:serine O-acetyltransferase
MKQSLTLTLLADYATQQANTFFPDPNPIRPAETKRFLPSVLNRLERCLKGLTNPYFHRDGAAYFDHLHSEQYSMFLYLLAHECGRAGEKHRRMAAKFYLLNKALHGLEVYYQVEMPEVFWFAHAVGSVLGRARYGNGFVVMQGCTVGNVSGRYPVFGERVVLCAGSSVLGDCRLGRDVCVGAGSLLINARIPAGSTVVGRGKDLRVLSQTSDLVKQYFRSFTKP